MVNQKTQSIDDYISSFDGITKERLVELYQMIKSVLPDAKEKISYGVPTFCNENGYIVYFAGYEDFVSVYPAHQAESLNDLVQPYLSGKSTARFLNDKPLPQEIIKKIVQELEAANKKRRSSK